MQGLLMAFMLVGARAAIRLRHAGRRQQVEDPIALATHETVLLVGLNAVTELFLRSVAELARDRVKVAGIVTKSSRHRGRRIRQHPVLGAPEETEAILKTLEVHGIAVDRIVVTLPFADLSAAARAALLDIERKTDIRLDLFAERIGLAEPSRPSPPQAAEEREPEPEIAISAFDLEAMLRRPYMRLKRVFDVTLAAVLIVLMMPLIVLVGFVVALDVGMPTVFWQQRPGARGRPFKLYKFRTMRSAHDEQGVRISDDERLTAVGRFLRRTRLDELPQLYNILIGEMSFVGPRPLLPADQSAGFPARLMAQPGLTGWAQVKGGREISASDKAALDVWYLRNASLWLDISILARTIPMLVFGERTEAEAIRQAWEELARGSGKNRSGAWPRPA
jgi:lipopolysaccharide/colanic/teichoic acid biosynthesis glycosyltransferase